MYSYHNMTSAAVKSHMRMYETRWMWKCKSFLCVMVWITNVHYCLGEGPCLTWVEVLFGTAEYEALLRSTRCRFQLDKQAIYLQFLPVPRPHHTLQDRSAVHEHNWAWAEEIWPVAGRTAEEEGGWYPFSLCVCVGGGHRWKWNRMSEKGQR